MKLPKRAWFGIGIAGLLLATALPYAAAAGTSSTPPAQTGAVQPAKKSAFWQRHLGELSKIIGTSEATLQSDVQNGMSLTQVLQQANLTPQQFRQRLGASRNYLLAQKRSSTQRINLLARILKLTPQHLRTDLQNHQKLSDIAKAQGMTMQQVRKRLRAAEQGSNQRTMVLRTAAQVLSVPPKTLSQAIRNHTAASLLASKGMTLTQLEAAVHARIDPKIKDQSRVAAVNQRIDKLLARVFQPSQT